MVWQQWLIIAYFVVQLILIPFAIGKDADKAVLIAHCVWTALYLAMIWATVSI